MFDAILKCLYTACAAVVLVVAFDTIVYASDSWPYGCCKASGGGSSECTGEYLCCTKPSQLGNCQSPDKPDYCYFDPGCSLILSR